MSESFITAAFLSVSGGLQDAYTYIFRGKVFANAQTGNIVLLGQNLVDRNWRMCVHYAVPLLFFALGIAAAECIKQKFQNMQQFHWRQIVVLCEIFLLLIVGFLPIKLNLLANAMVSFSCAMQVQAFRKVNGYAFASFYSTSYDPLRCIISAHSIYYNSCIAHIKTLLSYVYYGISHHIIIFRCKRTRSLYISELSKSNISVQIYKPPCIYVHEKRPSLL